MSSHEIISTWKHVRTREQVIRLIPGLDDDKELNVLKT